MKSKKEVIIDCFQKMDIHMLELLLDDSKTYQDATKNIFLQKLKISFNELKNSQDTYLKSCKGNCSSVGCNRGCSGYSFVGNNSKKHLDLIFAESNNDFTDIYHCGEFKSDYNGELNEAVLLEINYDEKADYKPSVDFLIKKQKSEAAYNELNHCGDNKIIDKEIYLHWLAKHSILFKELDFPPEFGSTFDTFHTLYDGINELSTFLDFDKESKIAYDEFGTVKSDDENALLIWLVKYEKLKDNLMDFGFSHFFRDEIVINIKSFKVGNINICSADYLNIINFKLKFDELYWSYLEKYTTFTDDDFENINENPVIMDNFSSLTYHLKERGLI